ncbi:hypothetical protein ACH4GK_37470 [Streptomyces rimosus]|nr:hypothetical protein [Streptomyces rimosus]
MNAPALHGCSTCHLPIQYGTPGLAGHRRTVHTSADDPRRQINVQL